MKAISQVYKSLFSRKIMPQFYNSIRIFLHFIVGRRMTFFLLQFPIAVRKNGIIGNKINI